MDQHQPHLFDYSKRSQWLRAVVLGANDGLVSTASLMMGIGAIRQDIKAMILIGFLVLVAATCSMAIGEFVSVFSQLDIELAQMKRDNKSREENDSLPNPLQATVASTLAFLLGSMVPLLAASFIKSYLFKIGVMVAAMTVVLAVFGWLGAALGRAPPLRSSVRVLVGGWMAMTITYALTMLIATKGLKSFGV